MKTKILEIRDEGTFIGVLCVDMNPDQPGEIRAGNNPKTQRYYLRRVGYPCESRPNILMTNVSGDGKATNDPYSWGDRTRAVAHNYIIEKWDSLIDGDVVDVEFINGDKPSPKISERFATYPNGNRKYADDGTMLNENGTRSVFDDIDL